MKVTFEMEDEQVDAILVSQLKQTIEGLEESLEQRANGVGISIFDSDPIEDIQYLNQYISAFKLALDWYGGEVD
jgi:phosphoserine aminotransferase